MRYSTFLLLLLLVKASSAQLTLNVPPGGNTFSSNRQSKAVTQKGIEGWSDTKETFTTYIYLSKPGTLQVAADGLLGSEASAVELKINGRAKVVNVGVGTTFPVNFGEWTIRDTGYVALVLRGVQKSGKLFPSIKNFKISGTAVTEKTRFVKDNEGNFFYWGRRGPSVHLNYEYPSDINAAWYYSEITVPENNDVIGSYFMANGFGEGYFGMQVNSDQERRILFSVWSPYSTDDPKIIPESHKIRLLKKGAGVYTGEFGNEGSGGQSYWKFNWKAGNTYGFLLKGVPSADSTTTYTAWFFAPELKEWKLIASFKRPLTKTYLRRFHSFLENFVPETGDIRRKAWYHDQWVANEQGQWTPIRTARVTTDNTGRKKYRMDFAGGLSGRFFMENCGFFTNAKDPLGRYTAELIGTPPKIDLNKLP